MTSLNTDNSGSVYYSGMSGARPPAESSTRPAKGASGPSGVQPSGAMGKNVVSQAMSPSVGSLAAKVAGISREEAAKKNKEEGAIKAKLEALAGAIKKAQPKDKFSDTDTLVGYVRSDITAKAKWFRDSQADPAGVDKFLTDIQSRGAALFKDMTQINAHINALKKEIQQQRDEAEKARRQNVSFEKNRVGVQRSSFELEEEANVMFASVTSRFFEQVGGQEMPDESQRSFFQKLTQLIVLDTSTAKLSERLDAIINLVTSFKNASTGAIAEAAGALITGLKAAKAKAESAEDRKEHELEAEEANEQAKMEARARQDAAEKAREAAESSKAAQKKYMDDLIDETGDLYK